MDKKAQKAVDEYTGQLKAAGYIIFGQASGATINNLVVSNLLADANTMVRKAVRVVLPGGIGVGLALTKNKHAKGVALGFGTQSALELIRAIFPSWSTDKALGEGSSFVIPAANGEVVEATVKNGQLVTTNGQKLMLPASNAEVVTAKKEAVAKDASVVTAEGELSDYVSQFAYSEDGSWEGI